MVHEPAEDVQHAQRAATRFLDVFAVRCVKIICLPRTPHRAWERHPQQRAVLLSTLFTKFV
eukprot:14108374-Heterocapsa_arctica.AAC.1